LGVEAGNYSFVGKVDRFSQKEPTTLLFVLMCPERDTGKSLPPRVTKKNLKDEDGEGRRGLE